MEYKFKKVSLTGILLGSFLFVSLAQALSSIETSELQEISKSLQADIFSNDLAEVKNLQKQKLLALADTYKAKVANGETSVADLREIKGERKIIQEATKKEEAVIKSADAIYQKCRKELLNLKGQYESGSFVRTEWVQQFNIQRNKCLAAINPLVNQSEILQRRQEAIFPPALKADLSSSVRAAVPKSQDINLILYGGLVVVALFLVVGFTFVLKMQKQKPAPSSAPSVPTSIEPENKIPTSVVSAPSSENRETPSSAASSSKQEEVGPPPA